MNVFLRGAGLSNEVARSYAVTFIAAVDTAVLEYERGRQEFLVYLTSANNTFHAFTAFSCWETSIHNAHRSIRILDRLRLHTGHPEFDRLKWKLIEADADDIKDVRNMVEHIDKEIAGLETDAPRLLVISDDCASLDVGDVRIGFDALARVLTRLHGAATNLADARDGSKV